MIFRLVIAALLAFALAPEPALAAHRHATPAPAAATAQLAEFDSEAAAQKHCPSDQVVWLNTNSGIYHEKGMRWYGRTKHGAYVCRKEADAAGDRDTRNGQ
jgi:hypothetical protein